MNYRKIKIITIVLIILTFFTIAYGQNNLNEKIAKNKDIKISITNTDNENIKTVIDSVYKNPQE